VDRVYFGNMSAFGQADQTPQGGENPSPKAKISFWKTCWEDIEHLARPIVSDMMLFLIVLGVLGLVPFMTRFLGIFGDYDVTDLKILERMHFWAYFAVLIAFMLDMVGQVATALFVRWTR
jgi:hypothetical protein